MAIGNEELMHECFPKHRAWEQQERNKMKQTKKRREYRKKQSMHEKKKSRRSITS